MLPLNVELYSILEKTFGSVKIAKTGEPFRYNAGTFAGSSFFEIIDYGETYRVCCPFCLKRGDPDHRYRLWISHVWGCYMPELDRRLWTAAKCFHNDCLADKDVLNALIDMVFISTYNISTTDFVYPEIEERKIPDLPGECIPLTQLPPDHKAIVFLKQRNFDPAELFSKFGVMYCHNSSQYPYAIDKLVFPIDFEGRRVGWQCRYIGNSPKNMPKYFSAPGMSISRYVYNYDTAKNHPYGVIVEGVFDAIRIGYAIAVFGKTISRAQLSLITSTWNKCLVFLDPDAAYDAEKIVSTLRQNGVKAIAITGHPSDPGKMPAEICHQWIAEALATLENDNLPPIEGSEEPFADYSAAIEQTISRLEASRNGHEQPKI